MSDHVYTTMIHTDRIHIMRVPYLVLNSTQIMLSQHSVQ